MKVVAVRAVKAHRENRKIIPHILNLGVDGGKCSPSNTGPLSPWKEPPAPIHNEAEWAPEPV